MNQHPDTPIGTDLVLIGGGHSHLFVLRRLAMNPVAGLRVTLVTRDLHTPYSGMLPGYVAGHYDFDETHIDLLPLARHAGARVVHDEVVGLDAESRQLRFRHRPALDYDLLSINIGSRPGVAVEDESSFAIKPVDRFIDRWHALERRIQDSDANFRLAVVGGGAGGVELALALEYRLRRLGARPAFSLITDSERLLPGHNASVRRAFEDILRRRSIEVHYNHRVSGMGNGCLHGDFDQPLPADAAIWATGASAAGWLSKSGLALDEHGFVAVHPCLQSLSHDNVFAAGDIASVGAYPRPRSGVFAVRQGSPLARNLLRRIDGRRLKPFRPQRQFLSLISCGERYAVAGRGRWALRGRWCWWLKDRIDRRFVRRFSEFPDMTPAEDAAQAADLSPMRCGGCGSKIGGAALQGVLTRVGERYAVAGESGFDHIEDAARIEPPAGRQLFQSIDHFRSFIDDPYLFGRIAANHALGDLFAMGVAPHSALVIANVVFASEEKQAQDLYQLMCGVAETLASNGTRLAGGHSGEAVQMSCGLSVNGFAMADELLLKSAMRPGDLLLLTRPLGSGVLFAAEMRGRARAGWIDAALAEMLVSSRAAADCLRRHGARACTDVTGFGFAGHLLEMADASKCAAQIRVAELPLYAGAVELFEQGIASSLQPQNARARQRVLDHENLGAHPAYPLLFDPQTAGGLLASIDAKNADQCLQELRRLGYQHTNIVGRVVEAEDPDTPLILVKSP